MKLSLAHKLKSKQVLFVIVVVAVIVATSAVAWGWTWRQRAASSYSDCVRQGNVVLYSYPSVCVDKNGQHFTNPAEQSPMIPGNAKPL